MTTSSEVCSLCGEREDDHGNQTKGCPIQELYISGYHPTNRFTPCPTGKEALQAGGQAKETVAAIQKFQAACSDLAAALPDTLPTLHPFNLARALAGDEVRTRGGIKASKPFETKQGIAVTLEGFTRRVDFDKQGRFFPDDGRIDTSPLDLFMASEASCEQCRGKGFVVMPDASTEPCDKCQPGAYAEFIIKKHSSAPPAPKSEQVSGISRTPHETETQRQARIESEAKLLGAVVEKRDWCAAADASWEPGFRNEKGEWQFIWKYYDHRIRPQPAPEKARRVWIVRSLRAQDSIFSAHDVEPPALPYDMEITEYVQLNSAVRAALEEKGMM